MNEGRVGIGTKWIYDTTENETYVNNALDWQSYTSGIHNCGLWNCYDSPLAFCIKGTMNTSSYVVCSPLAVMRPQCNWLSTINNLQNEIEKTSDKTMKVTYTLTLT